MRKISQEELDEIFPLDKKEIITPYLTPYTNPEMPQELILPEDWEMKYNLNETNLSGLKIKNKVIQHASIENSNLEGLCIEDSLILESSFTHSNLNNSIMKDCYIYAVRFNLANLKEADLSETSLVQSSLEQSNLNKINLNYSALFRCSFKKATLHPTQAYKAMILEPLHLTQHQKTRLLFLGASINRKSILD